jgi:hypothetical protein
MIAAMSVEAYMRKIQLPLLMIVAILVFQEVCNFLGLPKVWTVPIWILIGTAFAFHFQKEANGDGPPPPELPR